MNLPAALCALHHEVAVLYSTIARRFDLTLQQAELLVQLDTESKSFGELARLLGCDKSNMTGMADRLARRGLLERRTDPTDRRITKPALTDAGTELADRIRKDFGAAIAQRCANLSSTDQDQLTRLADSMAGALAAER